MKLTYKTVSGCMMTLIGSRLFGTPLPEGLRESLNAERCEALYRLSKGHDLAHIVGPALFDLGVLSGENAQKFAKQDYLAVYRYERIRYELASLRRVLSEAKIPFMPLKGAVLRDLYPDPAMRTSCDIDILIHKEDLTQATALLKKELSYKSDTSTEHDVSFFAPSDLHVELHYNLIDDNEVRAKGLGDAWENAVLKEGTACEYVMSGAFFYAYMTAHSAKHFYQGGCGVRPFLDLLIVKDKMPHDPTQTAALLQEQDLVLFDRYSEALARYWFCQKEADSLVLEMERYILEGGTYGSIESNVATTVGKKGRFRFLLRKIFPSFTDLKHYYPVLQRVPILLPFCHIARWFALLFFPSRRRFAAAHLRASRANQKNTDRIRAMHRKLHLE